MLKLQVDIRTASFMMKFTASENTICNLFSAQAARTLAEINVRYGNSVGSINSLKDAIHRQFNGYIFFIFLLLVCFLCLSIS